MVKITNGERITEVTKGAFKEIFSKQGWREYQEPVGYYSQEPIPQDEDVIIPFSEMTVAELKGYASQNGIDISAGKSKKEIIEILESER